MCVLACLTSHVSLFIASLAVRLRPDTQIVLTFFEMIAILQETFNITWPATWRRIISQFRAAFANLTELSALACAPHINQYAHLLFWTFGVIFVLLATYLRYHFKRRRHGESDRNSKARHELRKKFLKVLCPPQRTTPSRDICLTSQLLAPFVHSTSSSCFSLVTLSSRRR